MRKIKDVGFLRFLLHKNEIRFSFFRVAKKSDDRFPIFETAVPLQRVPSVSTGAGAAAAALDAGAAAAAAQWGESV